MCLSGLEGGGGSSAATRDHQSEFTQAERESVWHMLHRDAQFVHLDKKSYFSETQVYAKVSSFLKKGSFISDMY